jgi:uncharacterized protein DUF4349
MTRSLRARFIALSATTLVLAATACSAIAPVRQSAAPAAPAPAEVTTAKGGPPSAAAPPAPAALARSADAAAQPAAQPASAASGASDQAMTSQPLDRMVIRTAQLSLEVQDIETALTKVRQLADQGGGFVSASNTHVERVNDQDRTVADLTIQVRSSSVDEVVSGLRGLGKVTTESSGSQDVTEEYVDLDSNLRNLQASEAAILKLMDKATRIEDVLSLQRELTNVRGQIERIQGRKRYLERRTDMATIAVSLRLPTPESTARPGGGFDPLAVAQRGWQASLNVLRGAAEVVIVVLAFSWWLLPFLAVGAYVLLQRRRPRAAAAPPAGPTLAG